MRLAPRAQPDRGLSGGAGAGSALQTAWVRAEGRGFSAAGAAAPGGRGALRRLVHAPRPQRGRPHRAPELRRPRLRPHFAQSRPLWSDLAFVEADAGRPEGQRRVVVTATRAIKDHEGAP